jgi:hypothetical protein
MTDPVAAVHPRAIISPPQTPISRFRHIPGAEMPFAPGSRGPYKRFILSFGRTGLRPDQPRDNRRRRPGLRQDG